MIDVALRALSPGINDPCTAIEALNEIGTVLLYYTRQGIASTKVTFSDGECLYLTEPSYRELLDLGVNEIAIAGKNFHLVQARIREMLAHCASATRDPERTGALQEKCERPEAEFRATPAAALYN